MAAFVEQAAAHEWTGPGPGRIVITDDLVATMREYMSHAKFDDWFQRQQARYEGSGALGVGMAFVARDGVRTAVIANVGSRGRVLWLFGHEYIEAAIDERLAVAGFGEPETREDRHGRALWGEYVVERTRREVFSELGWLPIDLDRSSLVATAADAWRARYREDAWPYVVLTLDFAKAVARADAGVETEQAAVEQFLALDIATEAWADMANCFRASYERRDDDPANNDASAWSAWGKIWRTRR